MQNSKQDKLVFQDEEILSRNNEDFMFTEVDGESVIMNVETGHYFGLNSVSTDIWNILENEMNYNTLIQKVREQYDIDEETCRTDTRPVIGRMILLKIIHKQAETP